MGICSSCCTSNDNLDAHELKDHLESDLKGVK